MEYNKKDFLSFLIQILYFIVMINEVTLHHFISIKLLTI